MGPDDLKIFNKVLTSLEVTEVYGYHLFHFSYLRRFTDVNVYKYKYERSIFDVLGALSKASPIPQRYEIKRRHVSRS